MEHSERRRVALVVTSPARRATRRARPVVAALAALAGLVVPALLFLPVGTPLTWIMGLALAVLLVLVLVLVVVARRATGSTKALQGVPRGLHVTALTSVLLVGSATARYFTSLLLAPWLDAPETPTATLLWAVLTAVPAAAFLAWALSPIKPR